MIWRLIVTDLALWWGWNGIQVMSCASVSYHSRSLTCWDTAPGGSYLTGSVADGDLVFHDSGSFTGFQAGVGLLVVVVVGLTVVWWRPVTLMLSSRTPTDS
jgi:hypothetical protein